MYSLRRTLAVRMCLTMFAALLLIALWAQLGSQRTMVLHLDQSLLSSARMACAAIASGERLPRLAEPAGRPEFTRAINRFEVLRDSTGRAIDVNTPLALDLPLDTTAFILARNGGTASASVTWHDHRMRSVYLSTPALPGSVIQVAAALEPFAPISSRLIVLMFGTVILGSLATMFGAHWLVGSAMAPVEAIASEANSIRGGTTGQRITAHADVQEFEGLIQVLNNLLARLDRAFLVQQRLMSDVGHDMKTPITVMRGEMEVALRGERSPADYRAVMKSGMEELDRLAVIADGMTLLARIEAGEARPRAALVDVLDLAEERVAAVRPQAGRRIYRVARTQGAEALAMADATMLRLVLDHLLDNTVRHTPDGSTIDIVIRDSAMETELTVSDDGPGVPAGQRPHLFERFYRADAARGRESGAGLGLSVVAAAIQAHGGTVRADEAPGGGLRIAITLPRPSAKG